MEADPMNSNHPITELETAIRKELIHNLRENLRLRRVSVEAGANIEDLGFAFDEAEAALTALCRSFAASELRLAAGSDDELLGESLYPSNFYLADEHNSHFRMLNELRRTLRVRADELEGDNNVA